MEIGRSEIFFTNLIFLLCIESNVLNNSFFHFVSRIICVVYKFSLTKDLY
jgi:hypothetical protein